jgi:Leucine-rich repeat (LRR) protein
MQATGPTRLAFNSPRASGPAAAAPLQRPDFGQALAAEIDDPQMPPEERESLGRLRGIAVEWQRVNHEVALEITPPLDLSRQGLRRLPAALCMLDNLRELVADSNQLERLPPEIGQLQNLRVLRVSGNSLTELPRQIGQMRALEGLNVEFNQLERLPPDIEQLQNLRELNAGVNMITEVPPEIGQLRLLQRLDLRGNQLDCLPPEIGALENLRSLNVRGCGLTELPAQIGQLPVLEELDASDNQLGDLPREISHLQQLSTLHLQGNPLRELPPVIRRWQARVEENQRNVEQARMEENQRNVELETFVLSSQEVAALSHDDEGTQIEHADSFFDWLDKQKETAQYQNVDTRPALEDSLRLLIADMRGDVELRRTCFSIAAEALTSCGDRITVGLNQMHEAALIARTLRPGIDEKTVIGIGIDMFVLKLVDTEARAKITQLNDDRIARLRGQANARGVPLTAEDIRDGGWGEDVETILFFQTRLQALLAPDGINVPVPARGMLYDRCAGVSEADLAAAADRIRTTYHDGRSLTKFLTEGFASLPAYIEREYADQLTAAEAPFRAGLEDLEAQSEAGKINDGDYDTGMRTVMKDLEAAKTRLRQQLLQDVIKRHFGPPAA